MNRTSKDLTERLLLSFGVALGVGIGSYIGCRRYGLGYALFSGIGGVIFGGLLSFPIFSYFRAVRRPR